MASSGTAELYILPKLAPPKSFALGSNPLKWVRLACVDPVTAPQISIIPQTTGYPLQTDQGVEAQVSVTVTNDGNTTLNVTTIGFSETSGPVGGWLNVDQTTLTIAAGATNTATFNVIINAGGIINSGGIDAVNGEVFLLSDAPAPRDSISFFINDYRSENKKKTQARHSDSLNYSQLIDGVKKVLLPEGTFCLVLPYEESRLLQDRLFYYQTRS